MSNCSNAWPSWPNGNGKTASGHRIGQKQVKKEIQGWNFINFHRIERLQLNPALAVLSKLNQWTDLQKLLFCTVFKQIYDVKQPDHMGYDCAPRPLYHPALLDEGAQPIPAALASSSVNKCDLFVGLL